MLPFSQVFSSHQTESNKNEFKGDRNSIDHQWTIEEKTYFQNQRLAEVNDQIQRQTVGFIEFHAMLVRTDLFDRIGLLDEGCCCTKEYLRLLHDRYPTRRTYLS